jgi:dihydrodipicolinate reductase
MKISVLGASGSVGSLVVKEAESLGISVVGAVSEGENIGDLFGVADVVIDFSSPSAVAEMLSFVTEKGRCYR